MQGFDRGVQGSRFGIYGVKSWVTGFRVQDSRFRLCWASTRD